MYTHGYTSSRRKILNIENAPSFVATLGEDFFASFLIGYFIKKLIKVLMFILGGILALLMYLQSQGIINVEVNVYKIQSSAETVINTITANAPNIFSTDNNPSTISNNLGIPLTGSIASGFMLGITRGG